MGGCNKKNNIKKQRNVEAMIAETYRFCNACGMQRKIKIPDVHKKIAYVVLHDLRSIHNVGAIFRTADAVGASKIFTTGYTGTPRDRFGRERKDFAKTALGSEKNVSHEHVSSIVELLQRLHADHVFLVGVEQSEQSVDYKKAEIRYPCAFIFGNEVRGIEETVLNMCDVAIELPMAGMKESLNVSVSAGIILFHFLT